MVKIQIVSDTHLEFRGENFQKLIKPSAPILFLLGDICACGTTEDFDIYKKFMTFLAPKFKKVRCTCRNASFSLVAAIISKF